MWALDDEDRIVAWSRGAEQVFGYSSEQIIGEPVSRLTPADLIDSVSELKRARSLRAQGVVDSYETRRLRSDGEQIRVSLRQTLFTDQNGARVGSCTIARVLSNGSANGQSCCDSGQASCLCVEDWPDSGRLEQPCVLQFGQAIGQSPAMLEAFKSALRVAGSGATVMISGESGTGKELLAQAIHHMSDRAAGPMVAVNCAALAEHLLESELFGHEKGAFTDASRQRLGRFERASGGTLFLDEIGDMSLPLQAKILRALEEREIERLGGEGTIKVDVRVIAATNRDLGEDIKAGRFREDLYYRLAVIVIHLPPLRERGDDIILLARHFLKLFGYEYGRPVPGLAPQTVEAMRAYSWPGNVRELRNAMERALLLEDNGEILPDHLPPDVAGSEPDAAAGNGHASTPAAGRALQEGKILRLEEIERQHIDRALAETGGHLGRAAEILGIHRNTLRRKLRGNGSA
jgi:PAS domain S-box-containing protein